MDLRSFPQEFITQFIEVYKQNTCLWQIKSKDYSNKAKRKEAYDNLLKKVQEVYPTAERDFVLRKINSIRTNYRKEYKKVLRSKHSTEGDKRIYEPSLWYYHLLEFLNDQEMPNKGRDNKIKSLDPYEISNLKGGDSDQLDDENDVSRSSYQSVDTEELSRVPCKRSYKLEEDNDSTSILPLMKTKREIEPTNNVIDAIPHRSSTDSDRFDIFASNVAEKLRHLPNIQRICAEKLINDVLFEAELNSLNRFSRIETVTSLGQEQEQEYETSNGFASVLVKMEKNIDE